MPLMSMQGLKVDIKEIESPDPDSKVKGTLVTLLLIVFGLILLPLLLLAFLIYWVGGLIFNLFSSEKVYQPTNEWHNVHSGDDFTLKRRYYEVEDLPAYLDEYFKDAPLSKYHSEPQHQFFDGYFTEFKIERSDGVFLQKVIYDSITGEVHSLPIYFFKYQTREVEEVVNDLKDYYFDTKGGPDDFIISAVGKEKELEIRIKKD